MIVDASRWALDENNKFFPLCRRELAFHLKHLMGPWWFAQFDSVSEVSQAAKNSLEVCYSFLYYSCS